MPLLHSSTMPDVAKVSSKDIFEKAFPALFETSSEFIKKVVISYHFIILGEGGGFWVVDLKVPEVREGREADTDCVIEMDTEIFDKFVSGKLDVQAALKNGTLRITGEPDHIVALGHLMGG